MRFLGILTRPWTVVLLVLGLMVIVNGFLFYSYRYQAKAPDPDEASSGDKVETTDPAGSSTESSTEIGGAGYIENVGDIQNAAVQTFTRINDRIRR